MKALQNKLINGILLRLFSWLHNFSYKAISMLAVYENKGLHPKHRIMSYHAFFVDNIKQGSSVLDIGCGNGSLAFDIAKKASKVVAIDINKKNIAAAKKRYNANNIRYIVADATNYSFNESFDFIVLSNVLEHLANRVEFLRKIKKLSDRLLIRVPLLTRDWLSVYKKEKGLNYKLDSDHKIEYSLESFKKEIEKAGLKLKHYDICFGEIWAIVENR